MNKKLGSTVVSIGIISCIGFFIAGAIMFLSSIGLTTLRSVGGTSVAEAYYQGAGVQGVGFSLALGACGLAVLGMSIGLRGILDLAAEIEESRGARHRELLDVLEVVGKEILYKGME